MKDEEFPETVRLVTMITCWYVLAAIASSAMKQLLSKFAHPLALSLSQFVCATSLCLFRAATTPKSDSKCQPLAMSLRGLCTIASQYRVLGLQLGCGVIATSVCHRFALMLMPVSFTHTVKALQPLYAAVLSNWLLATPCPRERVAALVVVVSGVALSAYSELDYTWSGLVFAQMSVIAIALSSVLQKRYMRSTTSVAPPVLVSIPYASAPELSTVTVPAVSATSQPPTLDTNSVFFLTNAFALCMMFPAWVIFDSPALNDLYNGGFNVALLLVLTSFAVVAQHFASIAVLEAASTPITHAVASTFKRIFVITTSIVWFGNHVALLNAFGIFLSVCGVALYDRSTRTGKANAKLPTTIKPNGAISAV